jgi:hypothetical protein
VNYELGNPGFLLPNSLKDARSDVADCGRT